MDKIPFIIIILLLLVLYQIAKKKGYIEAINEVSKDEYGLKEFIPIGIAFNEILGEKFNKKVNKNAYEKIVRIYGIEAKEKFRIYLGNKTVLALLFTAAIFFFQVAKGEFSLVMTAGGVAVGIGVYLFSDSMLDKKVEERTQNIRYEFPEFLSKLSLLINAGLSFEEAWERVLQGTKQDTVLFHEFNKTCKEIKANIPTEVSLKNLARRCKVNEISKFSTIVIQNIKKGTSDITYMLTELSNECWNSRKALAMKKGEEASAKLLFPMILMLLSVFIITVVPALMQMFQF